MHVNAMSLDQLIYGFKLEIALHVDVVLVKGLVRLVSAAEKDLVLHENTHRTVEEMSQEQLLINIRDDIILQEQFFNGLNVKND